MVNELKRLRNEGVDNTLRISSLTLKGAAKLCHELFHAKHRATDLRFLADALIGWRKTVTKYVVNIDDSSDGEYPLERPSLARVCREKDGDKLADPSASRANESRGERLDRQLLEQTATTQLTSARPIRTYRWLGVAYRVCLLYSCCSSRIAYMTDDVFQGPSQATLPSPSLFALCNTIR
ncbi:MAG: hypothetical protein Q9175_002096 [Cornicularia normoerica]